jgi:hypothetical protein
MTTTAALDPRRARPLTSSEISEVLRSIIEGRSLSDEHTVATALSVTVAGLEGWCTPKDIATAVATVMPPN